MTSIQVSAPSRIPATIWPWSIVAFFVLLAIFNGFLVYWAVSNKPALVESSPYERGMKYQGTIDEIENAKRVGLSSTSRVERLEKQKVKEPTYLYTMTLTSERENFVNDLTEVNISARHASRPDLDFSGKLHRLNQDGTTFVLPLTDFSAGVWLIDIEVLENGEIYRIRKNERLS